MKLLLVNSVVSVLIAGVFVGAFLFVSSRVHLYHARADALYNNIALAEQKASNADAQRKVLRQLEQEHIDLGQFFFAEGDALAVIRTLERAAATQQLSAEVLSVDTVTDKRSPLGAYVVSIESKGSFEELVSFVAYVQSLPYALRVSAFSLSLVETENSSSWVATISVAGAYVTAPYQLTSNI